MCSGGCSYSLWCQCEGPFCFETDSRSKAVCQKEGCGEDSLGLLVLAGTVGLLLTGIVDTLVTWGR